MSFYFRHLPIAHNFCFDYGFRCQSAARFFTLAESALLYGLKGKQFFTENIRITWDTGFSDISLFDIYANVQETWLPHQ